VRSFDDGRFIGMPFEPTILLSTRIHDILQMEKNLKSPHLDKQLDDIPKLYETDGIPFEKKIIYQKWDLKQVDFYWLISELDKKENLAFGYANLNNDTFAEWGYISIEELLNNGAELDRAWKPCTFKETQKRIQELRKI
jgi:hypothetical protein